MQRSLHKLVSKVQLSNCSFIKVLIYLDCWLKKIVWHTRRERVGMRLVQYSCTKRFLIALMYMSQSFSLTQSTNSILTVTKQYYIKFLGLRGHYMTWCATWRCKQKMQVISETNEQEEKNLKTLSPESKLQGELKKQVGKPILFIMSNSCHVDLSGSSSSCR